MKNWRRTFKKIALVTLLNASLNVAANTVEVYETEKGTVSYYQCNPPIQHHAEMAPEKLEWHFQPYENNNRLAVSATFPSQINKVPADLVYLLIDGNHFIKSLYMLIRLFRWNLLRTICEVRFGFIRIHSL